MSNRSRLFGPVMPPARRRPAPSTEPTGPVPRPARRSVVIVNATTQRNPAPDYLRMLVEQSGLTDEQAARALGISDRSLRSHLCHPELPSYRKAPYPVQVALELLAQSSS